VSPLADVAAVDEEHEVVGEEGPDGVDHVAACHGRLVGRGVVDPGLDELGVASARLGEPLGVGLGLDAAGLLGELAEHGAGVAEQLEVGLDAGAELGGVDVDADDGGLVAHGGRHAVAHAIVGAGAGEQHEVGVGQDAGRAAGRADDAEEVVGRLVHRTAVPDGHQDRDGGQAGEVVELILALGVEHAGARDQHGPLGRGEQLGPLGHQVGVGRGVLAHLARAGRHVDHLVVGNLRGQHIDGNAQVHGAWPPAGGHGERLADVEGHLLGLVHLAGVLADGRRERHVVELLELAHVVLPRGALARDQQEWGAVERGVEHARERIDVGHTTAHRAHPHAPRQPGVGIGHVGGGLLVPRVDQADIRVAARQVERVQPVPAQRGHELHVAFPQSQGEQIGASHRESSSSGLVTVRSPQGHHYARPHHATQTTLRRIHRCRD